MSLQRVKFADDRAGVGANIMDRAGRYKPGSYGFVLNRDLPQDPARPAC